MRAFRHYAGPARLAALQPKNEMGDTGSLDALRAHLQSIPLVRAMQVEVVGDSAGRLRLQAPLGPNVNDKGSAFGARSLR